MKIPVVSGKKVVKILLREGFVKKRQKGSHMHLIKSEIDNIKHVTVPVHANEDLIPSVFRSIARQAGYTLEDFIKLF